MFSSYCSLFFSSWGCIAAIVFPRIFFILLLQYWILFSCHLPVRMSHYITCMLRSLSYLHDLVIMHVCVGHYHTCIYWSLSYLNVSVIMVIIIPVCIGCHHLTCQCQSLLYLCRAAKRNDIRWVKGNFGPPLRYSMVIVIIIITYKLLSYILSSLEICFYLIKGNVLSSFNYFILPKQSLSLVQHLGHKVMPCLPHPLLRPVPGISPPAPPSRWPCTCAMDVIVPVCIGHHFVCVGGHYCTVPVCVNHYHDMRQLIFPFFFSNLL